MGCPHVTPAKDSENHRKSLSRDEYENSARHHEYLSSLDDSDIIHKAKQLNEEQSFEQTMQEISDSINGNSEITPNDDSSVSFVVSVSVNRERGQHSSSKRKSKKIENKDVKNPVKTNVNSNINVQKESLQQRIDRVMQVDKNAKKTKHDTTRSGQREINSKKKKKSVREINASSLGKIDAKKRKKSVRDINASSQSKIDSKKKKKSVREINASSQNKIDAKKKKKSVRKINASSQNKIDSKKKKKSAREINASSQSKIDAKKKKKSVREINASNQSKIDSMRKKKVVRETYAPPNARNGYAFYYSSGDSKRKKKGGGNNKKVERNAHKTVNSVATDVSILDEKRVPDNGGEDFNNLGKKDSRIPYYEQKCSTPVLNHPFLNFEEKIDSDVEETDSELFVSESPVSMIIADCSLVVNIPSSKTSECNLSKQNEKIQQEKQKHKQKEKEKHSSPPLSEISQNKVHQQEKNKDENDVVVVPKNENNKNKEENLEENIPYELVQFSAEEHSSPFAETSRNIEPDSLGDLPSIPNVYPDISPRIKSDLCFDHKIATTKNKSNPTSPKSVKTIGKLRQVEKSFGTIIAMLKRQKQDDTKWNSQNNKELMSQELIMMEQYKELGNLLQLYEATEDVEEMQELAVILDRKYDNLNQLFFQYQTMFSAEDESSMMIDFDGLADESLVDEPSSTLVYESGKPHLLFEASLFQKYKRGRNAFRKTSNTSPKICAPYQSKFFPTEHDDDVDGSSMLLDICEQANSPLVDGF